MIASLLTIKKMSLTEEITVENLDHLGIVAGLIDEIKIVELINQKLGVDNRLDFGQKEKLVSVIFTLTSR